MRMALRWYTLQTSAPRPAPRLGEHTLEVLREAGFSAAEVAQLLATGAAVGQSGVEDAA